MVETRVFGSKTYDLTDEDGAFPIVLKMQGALGQNWHKHGPTTARALPKPTHPHAPPGQRSPGLQQRCRRSAPAPLKAQTEMPRHQAHAG